MVLVCAALSLLHRWFLNGWAFEKGSSFKGNADLRGWLSRVDGFVLQ